MLAIFHLLKVPRRDNEPYYSGSKEGSPPRDKGNLLNSRTVEALKMFMFTLQIALGTLGNAVQFTSRNPQGFKLAKLESFETGTVTGSVQQKHFCGMLVVENNTLMRNFKAHLRTIKL